MSKPAPEYARHDSIAVGNPLHRGRAGAWLPIVALSLVAFSLHGYAQPSRWTAGEWVEDLEYLETQIRTVHGNPFHALGKGELRSGFQNLRNEIPLLSDFEIAFEMQRLVASLGDGHSWLYYYKNDLSRFFPVDSYVFSDGLVITHAGKGRDKAVGARVKAIDGMPIAAVRETLLPYISRDNDMDVLRQLPLLIRQPLALKTAGIARKENEATFTLVGPKGDIFEESFSGLSDEAYKRWRRSVREPENRPVYLQKQDNSYWYQELPDKGTVYFQFNRFQEKFGQPFGTFTEELFGYLDVNGIDGLIIDIRHNAGGWTRLIDPLLEAIRARPRFQKRGNLYLITGRDTFSSALMLCVRLERETDVLFAGEPGAGKPNSYGEYNPYTLPNTRLKGSLSSKYHQESDPLDPRMRVEVDIPVALAYTEFKALRDPVLEAVLAHRRKVGQGPHVDDTLNQTEQLGEIP